jgi:hypothetical protein
VEAHEARDERRSHERSECGSEDEYGESSVRGEFREANGESAGFACETEP